MHIRLQSASLQYPILEYLEYLKGQQTEASSVHLQTQSSKFLDLSKLTKLPAGLQLRRLSIGKLKSKRYSSKFEGKLVYVLWSYQNSHIFMQANYKVGIGKNWLATVITPKYLAVRNFKFLNLKAVKILPISPFKCKKLLHFILSNAATNIITTERWRFKIPDWLILKRSLQLIHSELSNPNFEISLILLLTLKRSKFKLE